MVLIYLSCVLPLRLHDGSIAYWVTFLDGLQRVLLFTEDIDIAKKLEGSATIQKITQSVEVRIHGIGFSLINNIIGTTILYMGIASSGEATVFDFIHLHSTQVF